MRYGFRNRNGKAIVAYWLAAHRSPGGSALSPAYATLLLKNTGIAHPVLVDVTTGELKPLRWKAGTENTLEALPVTDEVMAITDETYFDWPVLPEVPSSLQAKIVLDSVKVIWQGHGGVVLKPRLTR